MLPTFPDFAMVPGTDVAVYDLYGVVAERGASGDHVTNIQNLLARQGLDVNVTGVFDQKTEMAVRAFEEAKGMRETGKVSNALLRILQQQSIIPLPSEVVDLPEIVTLPDGTRVYAGTPTLPVPGAGMSRGAKVALGLLFLAALSGGLPS